MHQLLTSLKRMRKILAVIFELTPPLFVLMPCIAILSAVLPFVNYYYSAKILDALAASPDMKVLLGYAAAAVGIHAGMLLIINALSRVRDVQVHKLDNQYKTKMALKTLDMDYQDLESPHIHELKRSIDQTKLRIGGITGITSQVGGILKNVLSLLVAFFTVWRLFSISKDVAETNSFWGSIWPLIIFITLVILSVLWTGRMQLRSNKTVSDLNKQMNEANGSAFLFMQLITDYRHGKDIRIYHMKEYLSKSFENLWNSSIGVQLFKKIGVLKGLPASISAASGAVISVLAYLLAGMKAISGEISVGDVVLYAGSIQVFVSAISVLIFSFGELLGSCDLQDPYLKYFDTPNSSHDGNVPLGQREGAHCEFEFRDVSFRYPGNDIWVLRHLSFTISSGEHIAIVGMNGSGKTTMIKLLCRLYDPTEGEILLNGINIQRYRQHDYWALFGVVFQDFKLLSLTLGQNIAASQEFNSIKAMQMLSAAGFSERLQEMPNALDTPLYKDYEDDGVEISGGEAQKIAIARALYKDAPLVVLDEPTAALDPLAEYEIYTKLNYLAGGKTAIYISHRLSSCRFCQRILTFDKGMIIQEGSHDELVSDEDGKYYELWSAQAQFYT